MALSLEREIHRGYVGGDTLLVKNAAIATGIVALLLALLLLGATTKNEGCLPWQERVGVGDGVFGEGQDFSKCAGSRLPFGWAALPVPH
ncbi:MAG TPA: hypothetical protein VJ787_01600 [Thermoleophilia bacterium]|nr:hypothetical protein [Thermoleophilia bacterium]